jgi:Asp-tRNA(Asn)/Glu-tRNA(Gln) amidotransferase A subunit family amidase
MAKAFGKLFILLIIAFIFFMFGLYFDDLFPEKQISKETVACAETLLGLSFTEAERDSMLEGLKEQRTNYDSIRAVKLKNHVLPAIEFNPIPVGWTAEDLPIRFHLSDYSYAALPEDHQELAFYSIGELAHLLKQGEISSFELTTFFIERLKKFGPELECIITLDELGALEAARQADIEIAAGKWRGPLHGIPFGIKDLFATKNLKTTWGAKPYEDQIIDMDATVVSKLKEAGAVMTVKLTMGALAWGDVWFGGKTRNPWDISQGSSGSSAGSAAAVSAGLVPFAIGTETWGSIVSPSTVCGVTGLRPTYGRVSRYGAMALSWTMDKIGPICRNVEDAAIVFKAIAGPDGKDQTVFDFPVDYTPEIEPMELRIGYVKQDFESDYAFHKQDSLALMKMRSMGWDLIPVELTDLPVEDISLILNAEAAAAFDLLTRSDRDDLLVRQVKNAWPNVFRTSRFIPAVEYINANRIRTLLIQEMHKLFKEIHVFIAPSWKGNTLLLTNMTGHPCVVVPNGFDEESHPTSITFIGDLFREGQVMALAKRYQDATNFHEKHP